MHDVAKTAILYGVIGIFHYIFRKQFLLISTNPEEAEAKGLSIRFWDFLFYASFGFVVTSSVAIAGVLLVFCYLVVPSVGAMLFADRIGRRLAIGWTMGTLVSALGVYFSVLLDLPTGAAIVCTFGAVLIIMFFVHLLSRRHKIPIEDVAPARDDEAFYSMVGVVLPVADAVDGGAGIGSPPCQQDRTCILLHLRRGP